MTVTPRMLFEKAMELWGRNNQLDVVVEECCELAKAVLKLKRAERKQIKGAPDMTPTQLETLLQECIAEVISEAGDVLIMLGQLAILVPGDYDEVYQGKLASMFYHLQDRGATFDKLLGGV